MEVYPFPVDDNIPGEEDIVEAVLRLQLHCNRGRSGMRAKHLRVWICAAMKEEDPATGKWEKVVTIIHVALRGGELIESCAWKMLMKIPKGGGTNFRGIGLVEVMWKAISGFINGRILSSI